MNNSIFDRTYTVKEVNTLIKGVFERMPFFSSIYVSGEISNWKPYRSGVFFDLKDEEGNVLSCTLWNDIYLSLPFNPKNGDKIVVRGKINVYVARGKYSLNVYELSLEGLGANLLALEALKKKLQAEGLFDESRKRPIPRFPSNIGIIVGKDSAAESDLITNLSRRYPLLTIYVFEAIVQGLLAPKSILKALKVAESKPLDTLIIARGGGSSEDLSAFNDENVVRALANFKVPTISAVGHEIDTTLVDFVSDLRVSTPTGAAEAATPNKEDLLLSLLGDEKRLDSSFNSIYLNAKKELSKLSDRPFFKDPTSTYISKLDLIANYKQRLILSLNNKLNLFSQILSKEKEHLISLSPKKTLERGYAAITKKDGSFIKSVSDVEIGDIYNVELKDGKIVTEVIDKE